MGYENNQNSQLLTRLRDSARSFDIDERAKKELSRVKQRVMADDGIDLAEKKRVSEITLSQFDVLFVPGKSEYESPEINFSAMGRARGPVEERVGYIADFIRKNTVVDNLPPILHNDVRRRWREAMEPDVRAFFENNRFRSHSLTMACSALDRINFYISRTPELASSFEPGSEGERLLRAGIEIFSYVKSELENIESMQPQESIQFVDEVGKMLEMYLQQMAKVF